MIEIGLIVYGVGFYIALVVFMAATRTWSLTKLATCLLNAALWPAALPALGLSRFA